MSEKIRFIPYDSSMACETNKTILGRYLLSSGGKARISCRKRVDFLTSSCEEVIAVLLFLRFLDECWRRKITILRTIKNYENERNHPYVSLVEKVHVVGPSRKRDKYLT